ncbi:MAG TPA: methyltransferase [Anaerolineae bacterium]|nr:methyltransferase [Anaerolineae bacterium]HOQ99130.1 methyltransferase [Anaerolineae bacterium]HPL27897.1 methyltransferase [Anaerolineae bacterium]
MAPILLGVAGFMLAFVFDWTSWRRVAYLKPIAGLATVATCVTALAWVLADPARYNWPGWTALAGWPLTVAGGLLLVYSLFIEIPFTQTYARQGVGNHLITTGTYALTRHPGVLWLGLGLLGLTLVSRGRLMLLAGIVWFVVDALYAWLQEVLLFDKMFPSYGDYRNRTPMLLPTAKSLARCLRTLPRLQSTAQALITSSTERPSETP